MSEQNHPHESEDVCDMTIPPTVSTEPTEAANRDVTVAKADSIEYVGPRSLTEVVQYVGSSIASCYDPVPMEKPVLPLDYHRMPWYERTAETLRYRYLRLLYSVSPKGGVQAWWKLVLLGFLVPVPVLLLVVCILWQVQLAMLSVMQIAISLAITLVAVLVIATLLMLFAKWMKHLRTSSSNDTQRRDYYDTR